MPAPRLATVPGTRLASVSPASRTPRGIEDGHVPEARRHTPVAHGIALRWFTLTVGEGSAHPIRALAADHVHRLPERERVRLIRHVLEHAGDLAVADVVERLARELEVVTLMVDRPRAAIANQYSSLGVGDDVVHTDVALTGQERHVRHALKLHCVP